MEGEENDGKFRNLLLFCGWLIHVTLQHSISISGNVCLRVSVCVRKRGPYMQSCFIMTYLFIDAILRGSLNKKICKDKNKKSFLFLSFSSSFYIRQVSKSEQPQHDWHGSYVNKAQNISLYKVSFLCF